MGKQHRQSDRSEGSTADGLPAASESPVADAAERARIMGILQKQRAGIELAARELSLLRAWEKKERETRLRGDLAHVSQKLMGELTGATRKTLLQWQAAGMPRRSEGAYDFFAVIPWLRRKWAGLDKGGESGTAKAEAERRIKVEDARKRKRENDEQERLLVKREAVIRVIQQQTLRFREDLQDLDQRLAVALGRCTTAGDRQAVLEEEHRKVCARWADGFKEEI